MSLEKERLLSLIEFAKQSALLKSNPTTDISKHGIFHEFEHTLEKIPGIHLNPGSDEDEIWLTIDRLHESSAPVPKNKHLRAWLDLPNTPFKEPILKNSIELDKFLAASFTKDQLNNTIEDSETIIFLDKFTGRAELESELKSYLETDWSIWATDEKKRRQSIDLYSRLFTLKQQLEGSIIDSEVELVWGTGLAVWNMQGTNVNYPLITQLVEIHLNPKNMGIEIRPRSVDFRFELDIYAAADNAGITDLENAYKDFTSKVTLAFSPFDHSSYEPLLQSAVVHLDSSGAYWPKHTASDDRQIPKASEELKVTDTWVLFARPRSKNLFIQDLERFKKNLDDQNGTFSLPRAVKNLVTEPSADHDSINLPLFRGVSMAQGNECHKDVADLFFPMPFNEEQVRIIQMLECYDGVVVQGPPGTGKTHTIANIISHYLALGKRVLVTSMKDPALTVLREKLPEDFRSLAISLLSSELEGMKQFEYSISKIASELQRIDRYALSNEIKQIEKDIDLLHAKLAETDRKIREMAKNATQPIYFDGEQIYPEAAAKELVKYAGHYEWLDDPIPVNNNPKFDNVDIVCLREARKKVGKDLIYLDAKLPDIALLPNLHEILRTHQDLSKYTKLQESINEGEVPALTDSSEQTLQHAIELFESVCELIQVRKNIENSNKYWSSKLSQNLKKFESETIIELFELLGNELETAINELNQFLAKPISIPDGIELDELIIEAIANKACGKSAFGLSGLIGKGHAKKKINEIYILTTTPKTKEDWDYVHKYVLLQRKLRELVMRWNGIGQQIAVEVFAEVKPAIAASAYENFIVYRKIKQSVFLEKNIVKKVFLVFPSWAHHIDITEYQEHLYQLQNALEHHLVQHRLATSWRTKEQLLNVLLNCTGQVTEEMKKIVKESLGNKTVSDTEVQNYWTGLINEINRVHDLKIDFDNIRDICKCITESGAPIWGEKLKKESFITTIDRLLPNNWQQAWRLKRLTTYIDSIGNQSQFKEFSKKRSEIEKNLAKAYQETITKRTWLKLAENATPDIRAALEAFRVAVSKIGKGTGKRAIRYRQDARSAANRANGAIPCWIMCHHKVSESLPAQFGCFDLVIVDEASQSDLSALPALLRADKVLIVGDDKQVSPDGVGLEEEKIRNLMTRFLATQVELYRAQMTPERSIYDLFTVVFSRSSVMLKEHFRCTNSIIEYSKREFYRHELKPIRIPKASERLDPPLVDVFVEDGFRKGDINPPEAQFIVDEIKKICADPAMIDRTIGVVSLLANKQALEIWHMLEKEVGPELMSQHKIACGDARTFQGKERDIMFLSLVVTPENNFASNKSSFEQRFNVAASRARDRMYLVRSAELDDLSPADKLRRGLINHFAAPFSQDENKIKNLRELCESEFELEIYDILTEHGYKVTPQVKVGEFRIDMVVEGQQDSRIAIECDGDCYHGIEQWENDMNRQRILERAGWNFWRCFASTFVKNRHQVVEELISTLREHRIEPVGQDNTFQNIYSEYRRVQALNQQA